MRNPSGVDDWCECRFRWLRGCAAYHRLMYGTPPACKSADASFGTAQPCPTSGACATLRWWLPLPSAVTAARRPPPLCRIARAWCTYTLCTANNDSAARLRRRHARRVLLPRGGSGNRHNARIGTVLRLRQLIRGRREVSRRANAIFVHWIYRWYRPPWCWRQRDAAPARRHLRRRWQPVDDLCVRAVHVGCARRRRWWRVDRCRFSSPRSVAAAAAVLLPRRARGSSIGARACDQALSVDGHKLTAGRRP